MSTIFSNPLRRRRLDQAIENLLLEGFTLIERTDLRAVLERKRQRFLVIPQREVIILEVDAFGHIKRTRG